MAAPDAEAIVTAYLKATSGVTSITERIVGKTPSNVARPWVRVTLLDDPSIDGGVTDRAVEAYLQLDCYAGKDGDQETASDLRTAVRTALSEIHLASHSGATMTGPPKLTSTRVPDTSFEPAMECYVVTATIWMRAA